MILCLRTESIRLHRELLDRLLLNCQGSETDLSKKRAMAIWLAEAYLKKLYDVMPESFDDIETEILFFKSIKPLFVVEREYHQRQYHASLFGVHSDGFWEQELFRMERLLAEHSEFSDYYHGDYTHNDSCWFTQGQAPLPTNLCMQAWETNPKHTSARDGWVGGLLAVERYRDWLKAKQGNLKQLL